MIFYPAIPLEWEWNSSRLGKFVLLPYGDNLLTLWQSVL